MSEILEGELEKIVYSNEREDYSVAVLRLPKVRHAVTITGNLRGLAPGQPLRVAGEWVEHEKYGRQFRVESVESQEPSTIEGILKYLGSGIIDGIGPAFARRIVDEFGDETFQILDNNPELLRRVPGIGSGRIEKIRRAWQEQRQIRDVMVFLQSHGVGPALAVRIFSRYGSRSIDVVRHQPYSLAMDIWGIGFLKADEIASRVGIARNAPERARAGVLHLLRELGDEGHVCVPETSLMEQAVELLQMPEEAVRSALQELRNDQRVRIEPAGALEGLPEEARVYLSSLHASETGVALRLREILKVPEAPALTALGRAGSPCGGPEFQPSPEQEEALGVLLRSRVAVLTGGPGTGKTTLLKVLTAFLRQALIPVALAAPTGRAARRLSEATGCESKTIHRLLEYSRGSSEFLRNRAHPLDAWYVIIDEASMIDVVLMYHLLQAIPDGARLLLVGDANQLPSVGPGNVLRDMIESGRIPTAALKQIFRQAQASRIVTSAHRVLVGQLPDLQVSAADGLSDFYFIEEEQPAKVLDKIRQLVLERIVQPGVCE